METAPLFIRRMGDDAGHDQLVLTDEFGRIVGNQSATIVSRVEDLVHLKVRMVVGLDVKWGHPEPLPQDLAKAMAAFGALSPANRERFKTALAHLL